jgi:hypothetical protein
MRIKCLEQKNCCISGITMKMFAYHLISEGYTRYKDLDIQNKYHIQAYIGISS